MINAKAEELLINAVMDNFVEPNSKEAKMFSQSKLEKLNQEINNASGNCDGCRQQCHLGARMSESVWYPTIGNATIKKYFDAQGNLQLIFSSECPDPCAAFKMARKISQLCDSYKKQR